MSEEGVMKLWGVPKLPKLPNGTGEEQIAAVFTAIEEWNLTKNVQFMSFDKTASKARLKTVAFVLLVGKMKTE